MMPTGSNHIRIKQIEYMQKIITDYIMQRAQQNTGWKTNIAVYNEKKIEYVCIDIPCAKTC